jgi:type II secretory pathway component PulJ
MPETPLAPAPDPARRRRLTILTLMAAVALFAVVLSVIHDGLVSAERARSDRLRADVVLAEARLRWTLAMRERGYVTAAKLAADRARLARIRSELKSVEGR